MKVDRGVLCELIPHSYNMCLLDSVESWDEKHIICITHSHRSIKNPLRSEGGLASVNALEYAAQVMAVHGGLKAQQQGKRISTGYLVAVRNASFYFDRLDMLEQPLILEATLLFAADTNQIYQIKVSTADQTVAEARLTTMNTTEPDR